MADTAAIGPWANFGLAGLVILALFMSIKWIGQSLIMEIIRLHRDERLEWLQMSKDYLSRNDHALEKVTQAITDLHRAIEVLNNRERRFNSERKDLQDSS